MNTNHVDELGVGIIDYDRMNKRTGKRTPDHRWSNLLPRWLVDRGNIRSKHAQGYIDGQGRLTYIGGKKKDLLLPGAWRCVVRHTWTGSPNSKSRYEIWHSVKHLGLKPDHCPSGRLNNPEHEFIRLPDGRRGIRFKIPLKELLNLLPLGAPCKLLVDPTQACFEGRLTLSDRLALLEKEVVALKQRVNSIDPCMPQFTVSGSGSPGRTTAEIPVSEIPDDVMERIRDGALTGMNRALALERKRRTTRR